MDLALNTAGSDLDLGTTGLDQPYLKEGTNAIAQHLLIRLRTFLGEWFLDQRQGVPYFRDILVKNPSAALVNSIFRRVLLGTPGVVLIEDLQVNLDKVSRSATLTFTATLDTGELIGTEYGPFIVRVD